MKETLEGVVSYGPIRLEEPERPKISTYDFICLMNPCSLFSCRLLANRLSISITIQSHAHGFSVYCTLSILQLRYCMVPLVLTNLIVCLSADMLLTLMLPMAAVWILALFLLVLIYIAKTGNKRMASDSPP